MDLKLVSDEDLVLELAERLAKKTEYTSPVRSFSMQVAEFVEITGRQPAPEHITDDEDPDVREVEECTSVQLYLDKRCAGELIFDPDGKLISCQEVTF